MRLIFGLFLGCIWAAMLVMVIAALFTLWTLYELYYMPLRDSPFMIYQQRGEAWRLLEVWLAVLAGLFGLRWLLGRARIGK